MPDGLAGRAAQANRDLLDVLCDSGHLSGSARQSVQRLCQQQNVSARGILLANGWISTEVLTAAEQQRWGAGLSRLEDPAPCRELIDAFGAENCLRQGVLPWFRIGGGTVFATSNPDGFEALKRRLPDEFGRPVMVLTSREIIRQKIAALYRDDLVNRAETLRPEATSCRNMLALGRPAIAATFLALAAFTITFPSFTINAMFVATLVLLTAVSLQKLRVGSAALIVAKKNRPGKKLDRLDQAAPEPPPGISLFVPLLREAEVAGKLIAAMEALQYPRALLEIMILVEEDDAVTQDALSELVLAPHLRVLLVPRGTLKTKPRALNYALPFAMGDVIGVYDAEDRPEPDQLLKVAAGFAEAPANVACLQGRLEFYNARQNVISRCFALDYGAWFHLMLPGLAALDLPTPLGGTTLFIKRKVIEELGGWDAHNVTEDAELGFRMYASGYRVQLLDSTTFEEANCRSWPWIKQRSRWMKGYLKTWLVLMRQPRQLYRDMGPRGFLHFQVLVLGALGAALSGPLLWSLFLPTLGILHPLLRNASPLVSTGVLALPVTCSVISFWYFAAGARAKHMRWLWPWIPAVGLYYLMAIPAVMRAIYETARKPHHWEKTVHGHASEPVKGIERNTRVEFNPLAPRKPRRFRSALGRARISSG